ncbi:hypothetical protein D043_0560B, partial [Vibrio parahaemolyticus EKP-021]
ANCHAHDNVKYCNG